MNKTNKVTSWLAGWIFAFVLAIGLILPIGGLITKKINFALSSSELVVFDKNPTKMEVEWNKFIEYVDEDDVRTISSLVILQIILTNQFQYYDQCNTLSEEKLLFKIENSTQLERLLTEAQAITKNSLSNKSVTPNDKTNWPVLYNIALGWLVLSRQLYQKQKQPQSCPKTWKIADYSKLTRTEMMKLFKTNFTKTIISALTANPANDTLTKYRDKWKEVQPALLNIKNSFSEYFLNNLINLATNEELDETFGTESTDIFSKMRDLKQEISSLEKKIKEEEDFFKKRDLEKDKTEKEDELDEKNTDAQEFLLTNANRMKNIFLELKTLIDYPESISSQFSSRLKNFWDSLVVVLKRFSFLPDTSLMVKIKDEEYSFSSLKRHLNIIDISALTGNARNLVLTLFRQLKSVESIEHSLVKNYWKIVKEVFLFDNDSELTVILINDKRYSLKNLLVANANSQEPQNFNPETKTEFEQLIDDRIINQLSSRFRLHNFWKSLRAIFAKFKAVPQSVPIESLSHLFASKQEKFIIDLDSDKRQMIATLQASSSPNQIEEQMKQSYWKELKETFNKFSKTPVAISRNGQRYFLVNLFEERTVEQFSEINRLANEEFTKLIDAFDSQDIKNRIMIEDLSASTNNRTLGLGLATLGGLFFVFAMINFIFLFFKK